MTNSSPRPARQDDIFWLMWQQQMGADEAHQQCPQSRFSTAPIKPVVTKTVSVGSAMLDMPYDVADLGIENEMTAESRTPAPTAVSKARHHATPAADKVMARSSVSARSPISDNTDIVGMAIPLGNDVGNNHLSARPSDRAGKITMVDGGVAANTVSDAPLGSFVAMEQAQTMARACKDLSALQSALMQYEGCGLKYSARQMVFGHGVETRPRLMVIGDAPDAVEDKTGQAFSGAAGQLIKKALGFIGLSEDKNLYFTNSVYWKRPGNRAASLGEQRSCLPFLQKQIMLIEPAALLILGIGGVMSFLGVTTLAKGRALKKPHVAIAGRDIPLLVAFHPDHYLKDPSEKASLWEDLLCLQDIIPS